LTVGIALADALRFEAPDLVFTGLQSEDQGFGQTGVVLAELLGISHSTIIVDVEVSGEDEIRVKRELEGGWFQWVVMPMPSLLTIQSGINQLRYATLKGIMAAKKKEIQKIASESTAGESCQIIADIYVPEKGKKTRFIEGSSIEVAKELVRVLREDARVF
jgi:electron transfer flavoprotein beta subunit